MSNFENKEAFTEQDLVDLSDGQLQERDVILLPTKFDYGCNKKHPLDLMTFYNGSQSDSILDQVNSSEYGISKPQRNQEPYMRLFVRDPSKKEVARKAFKRLCDKVSSK